MKYALIEIISGKQHNCWIEKINKRNTKLEYKKFSSLTFTDEFLLFLTHLFLSFFYIYLFLYNWKKNQLHFIKRKKKMKRAINSCQTIHMMELVHILYVDLMS